MRRRMTHLFVGVEAGIETGSSILDARVEASFELLQRALIRASTTLNENCTLGTLNFRHFAPIIVNGYQDT